MEEKTNIDRELMLDANAAAGLLYEIFGTEMTASPTECARSFEDIIYYAELETLSRANDGLQVFHTLTRSQPPGWKGYARRIDEAMLREAAGPLGRSVQVFICGPTLMVEAAANALVKIGIDANQIRTERFGPTGG